MKKQPLPVPRNNLNKKIEINNLPKSAAAAMLVTSHDINFVMGFIKEDEILTHDNYVRHSFLKNCLCRFYLELSCNYCVKSVIYKMFHKSAIRSYAITYN